MGQTSSLPDGKTIEVTGDHHSAYGYYSVYNIELRVAGVRDSGLDIQVKAGSRDEAERKVARMLSPVVKAAIQSLGSNGYSVSSIFNSPHGRLIDTQSGGSPEYDVLKLYEKNGVRTVQVSSGKTGNEYTIARKNNVLVCSCASGNIRRVCRHLGHVNKLVLEGQWTI